MAKVKSDSDVYVIRCMDHTERRRRWIAYDRVDIVRGTFRTTLKAVLARLAEKRGEPIRRYVRYSGVMRASEAACTIAAYQHPTH